MSAKVARRVNRERALLRILTAAKLAARDCPQEPEAGRALFPASCVTPFWADEELL
jgi:hypothetical protein